MAGFQVSISGRFWVSTEEQKVVQSLAFFSNRGVRDLTRLKAAKLLYFADKYHLLKYGRPITGDHYYCLKLGPVPGEAVDLMNEAEQAAAIKVPFDETFGQALSVEKSFFHQYPRFVAKRDPDLEVFSDSEIEALEDTIAQYGKRSARELVELTHSELGWIAADKARPIDSRTDLPYESFFRGAPATAQRVLELVKVEQEDRDLAAKIAR